MLNEKRKKLSFLVQVIQKVQVEFQPFRHVDKNDCW